MKIAPFALERWMTAHELSVDYDICESGIWPMTVDELLGLAGPEARDALLERVLDTRLGYSEARGTEELRELLAATYADTTAENILITTGAIEANFLLFNVLLDPGDHVVAVYPAYQQLYSVPEALGCEVSRWELRPDRGFQFDLDELERLVTPRTKLIVINSPHNPTGAMLSAADMERIYALAERVDARVLSDESYRWLDVPGDAPLAPPMRNLGDRAISVGTFSKPFGLPGLRIGWMVAPEDLVQRCWGMRDYVSLSPGKLNDYLAIIALRHLDRVVARNHAIMEANLSIADRWLANGGVGLSWVRPRAGLLALLKYDDVLPMPSLELANRLSTKYGVMLAPGSAFGFEGYVRIGIGADPAVFAAGLERFGRALNDFRSSASSELSAARGDTLTVS